MNYITMFTNYITTFARMHPNIYLGLIALVCLIFIVISADYLLLGISNWAKKFGISDYLIGLIAVALGASMPEFVSSLTGGSVGEGGIIFGTILGSNLFGSTIILGLGGVLNKGGIKLSSKLLNSIKYLIPILLLTPVLFAIDGVIGRTDAVIMLVVYLAYLIYIWKKEGELGTLKEAKLKHIWQFGLVFVFALVAILLFGRWLVFSSLGIANNFGISPYIISLFILGVGAQIPDLIMVIRSVLKKKEGVGIGELFGSAIAKCNLFFGILALINPIKIPFETIWLIGLFILINSLIIVYNIKKGFVGKFTSVIHLSLYVIFITIQLFFI